MLINVSYASDTSPICIYKSVLSEFEASYEWKETNDGIVSSNVEIDERWFTYNIIFAEATFTKSDNRHN